jgi:hypothetical protein
VEGPTDTTTAAGGGLSAERLRSVVSRQRSSLSAGMTIETGSSLVSKGGARRELRSYRGCWATRTARAERESASVAGRWLFEGEAEKLL